ncbi:MAG: nuclear transport factor 2 family protein [Rubrivivax sp.]|nr:nuclear transport factor 2 family protein [Rubrivivax sp.]
MAHHKPPGAALLDSPDELEAQFYRALQRADLERLMAVWADDDEVVCVHPGGLRVIGTAAIRASFESMFSQGGVAVHIDQVHRLHTPGCAVHHLVERVHGADDAPPAWVLATNVYLKTTQGWRMVAHHASPGQAHAQSQPAASHGPSTLH